MLKKLREFADLLSYFRIAEMVLQLDLKQWMELEHELGKKLGGNNYRLAYPIYEYSPLKELGLHENTRHLLIGNLTVERRI